MFETNTASCGGFPGVSDSFGAALWAIDYGLTMAVSNFSHALLHIGGQNVYYNVRALLSSNQHLDHKSFAYFSLSQVRKRRHFTTHISCSDLFSSTYEPVILSSMDSGSRLLPRPHYR